MFGNGNLVVNGVVLCIFNGLLSCDIDVLIRLCCWWISGLGMLFGI